MSTNSGIDDQFSVFVRGDLRKFVRHLIENGTTLVDLLVVEWLRLVAHEVLSGFVTFSSGLEKNERRKQIVAPECRNDLSRLYLGITVVH